MKCSKNFKKTSLIIYHSLQNNLPGFMDLFAVIASNYLLFLQIKKIVPKIKKKLFFSVTHFIFILFYLFIY